MRPHADQQRMLVAGTRVAARTTAPTISLSAGCGRLTLNSNMSGSRSGHAHGRTHLRGNHILAQHAAEAPVPSSVVAVGGGGRARGSLQDCGVHLRAQVPAAHARQSHGKHAGNHTESEN